MMTSPEPAHGLRIRRHHRQRTEIMQDIFCRDGLLADAAFGKRKILGDRRIEMVADHQHVQMLVDGVAGGRPRRIGEGRQHVFQAGDLDDSGAWPAPAPSVMEGVNGAALEGFYRVFDKA